VYPKKKKKKKKKNQPNVGQRKSELEPGGTWKKTEARRPLQRRRKTFPKTTPPQAQTAYSKGKKGGDNTTLKDEGKERYSEGVPL